MNQTCQGFPGCVDLTVLQLNDAEPVVCFSPEWHVLQRLTYRFLGEIDLAGGRVDRRARATGSPELEPLQLSLPAEIGRGATQVVDRGTQLPQSDARLRIPTRIILLSLRGCDLRGV